MKPVARTGPSGMNSGSDEITSGPSAGSSVIRRSSSSAGFVLFASAAILFQTSEIVHRAGETNYILATITLYVSIYNLFVSLLSILGIMSQD